MNVIHQYINKELIKNKSCMIDRITFDNISHHALVMYVKSAQICNERITRGAENAGPESAESQNVGLMMSSLRDQKYSAVKCWTENAETKNGGIKMQDWKMQHLGPAIQIVSSAITCAYFLDNTRPILS